MTDAGRRYRARMDAEEDRVDGRQLFEALRDHTGADAYGTVVEPWLGRTGTEYCKAVAEGVGLLVRTAVDGPGERCGDLLQELYALSRVSDVLLPAFQPPADRTEPWSTAVTMAQYRDLFNRAGVRVRAGARHAERGVADRSPLYWAYRRRHRPTVDESMGWGSNSQWRTDLRVDLRTEAGDVLNACGRGDIDDTEGFTDASLTPQERRELLCHRCLVRTPADVAELAATPDWEADLYPFRGRLRMPAE
jgi:hypothetical protein